uniref:Cytochrome c oxidase subunit NDUFA4 n=1 Tax=Takifugu rubripes TaxID=31033 RepID=A0A3B5JYJ4_TAKRU
MYGYTGQVSDRQTGRHGQTGVVVAVRDWLSAVGGARQCASGPSAHTRFLRPQHFSSRRNQDRQWIITRHVVDVRGHSETAEEPPGSDPSLRFIGGGATMSMLYLSRLALRNPDVSWDRKNNPEPWNKMEPTQQYKLFAVNMDYSKLKKDRPDF